MADEIPAPSPADRARAAAVRAVAAALLAPVLLPALLAAPLLAVSSLLRTRRLDPADADGPRRLARVALVLGLGQLLAATGYAVLVGWALTG